jgi:hypothetical protein
MFAQRVRGPRGCRTGRRGSNLAFIADNGVRETSAGPSRRGIEYRARGSGILREPSKLAHALHNALERGRKHA